MEPGNPLTLAECYAGFPLPLLVVTSEGVAVYQNPAYQAMFGSDMDRRAQRVAACMRRGRAAALRAVMRGASRVVPVGAIGDAFFEVHYFPVRDAGGATVLVGMLLVEARDAPVASPSHASTARDIEQSLRFILDRMPQLVWSTRPDGYVDFYNCRWYEYTGETPETTCGAGWNDPVHPDDQQRAWERWERSVTTGEPYEIEYRFRRADGEYRWFLGRALPMRDESGRVVRWFGTSTDIDDQKRVEQHRAEVLAQAEANNRMKDEFLANVSHELRTPLTAILGWARMQRARPELVPKAMTVIEHNAEVQVRLIEDILETSRIVTGKIRLHAEPTELNDIVQAAADVTMPTAEAKGVLLDVSLERALPQILGDSNRLRQVMSNLLANAVKFTQGGGRVTVRTAAVGEREVSVTVEDTGKGIPPAFLPHLFERFRQADASSTRTSGGLGLGLAIVKHLVELHGGTVSGASDGAGKGATFAVRLPAQAVPCPLRGGVRAAGASEERAGQTEIRLDGVRVLVVDDEPDTRELIALMLREAGAETREAESVPSALEAMDRGPSDVLVSDIGMPLRDGYSLVRELRSRCPDRGGRLPALALTAFARGEDVERARDAGFQLHLSKPVEPEQLVAAVYQLSRHDPEGIARS